MQIEGSADEVMVARIEDVIKENYEDESVLLISMNTTHVANDEVYIVQIVTAYEGEDKYEVTCETLRVDVTHHAKELNFTTLASNTLDLTHEVEQTYRRLEWDARQAELREQNAKMRAHRNHVTALMKGQIKPGGHYDRKQP